MKYSRFQLNKVSLFNRRYSLGYGYRNKAHRLESFNPVFAGLVCKALGISLRVSQQNRSASAREGCFLFRCQSLSIFVLLLLINSLLIGCNASTPQTQSPNTTTATPTLAIAQIGKLCDRTQRQKPRVVTTVAPITNIVSNIAGDRVEIKGIISEGTDSHTFIPRPSHTELLASADLIIINGLNLEKPTADLAKSVKCKNTKIYELGNNTITKNEWMFDFSFPKEKGDPNPHLWVNPIYAQSYAKLAATLLTELDPAGKDYYANNLNKYLQRLDALDKVTREVVASIPTKNRQLLTYHDSWAYWSRQYTFKVVGAMQPSNFEEPSAAEMEKIVSQIEEVGVPAIFGSEVYPSQIAEKIANKAHVKTANTSDDELPGKGSAEAIANTNPQHTYIGMMANNLRIIATNLGGKPELVNTLKTANIVGPTANK